MHFDDRLSTVLNQPVSGEVIARIQYIQLLDLLGAIDFGLHSAEVEAAHTRLLELAKIIPLQSRAKLLNNSGLRIRSPAILALLAQDEPIIASAAIAMARGID